MIESTDQETPKLSNLTVVPRVTTYCNPNSWRLKFFGKREFYRTKGPQDFSPCVRSADRRAQIVRIHSCIEVLSNVSRWFSPQFFNAGCSLGGISPQPIESSYEYAFVC